MALTLTSTITATDTVIQVTGTVGAEVVPGYVFQIDEEVLRFGRFERSVGGPLTAEPTADDTDRWSVSRAWNSSAEAEHTAGAAVIALSPNPFTAGIKVKTVRVPSASILTLNSVGFEVLPAVPGISYWPIAAWLRLNPGEDLYTMASSEVFLLGDSQNAGPLMATVDVFMANGNDLSIVMVPNDPTPPQGWMSQTATPVGLAMTLTAVNDDPDDGDGTVDLTVVYIALDHS